MRNEPVAYCDCGHRMSAHQNPAVGNKPGRCLHCRCEGWHERNVWVTDDRPRPSAALTDAVRLMPKLDKLPSEKDSGS